MHGGYKMNPIYAFPDAQLSSEKYVEDKLKDIKEDEDLSRYIL